MLLNTNSSFAYLLRITYLWAIAIHAMGRLQARVTHVWQSYWLAQRSAIHCCPHNRLCAAIFFLRTLVCVLVSNQYLAKNFGLVKVSVHQRHSNTHAATFIKSDNQVMKSRPQFSANPLFMHTCQSSPVTTLQHVFDT